MKTRSEHWAAAVGLLCGALTDWAGIAAITYLIANDKLSDEWAVAIVGLATGTLVSKVRGKLAGSTSAVVGALAAKAGLATWLKKTLFFASLLMLGCGPVQPYVPTIVKTAEAMIEAIAERASDPSKVDVQCEHEWDASTKTLLMLCEAEIDD